MFDGAVLESPIRIFSLFFASSPVPVDTVLVHVVDPSAISPCLLYRYHSATYRCRKSRPTNRTRMSAA